MAFSYSENAKALLLRAELNLKNGEQNASYFNQFIHVMVYIEAIHSLNILTQFAIV